MKYSINEFLYFLKNEKRLSNKTIESYKNDLEQYRKFLEQYRKIKTFEMIEKQDIEAYLSSLKRRDCAKSTIARKLTAIKGYHKYLLIEYPKDVEKDVALNVAHPKKEERLPTVLEEDEMILMLDSSQGNDPITIRNKAMMEVLYAGGLRVSELVGLKLENLHIKMAYITVLGKGRKERVVPIGEEACNALKNYLINARIKLVKFPTDYVFLNYQGGCLSRISVFKYLKKLALDNGISKEISPHTIRHSYATHMLKHGTDIRFIQELLGHESIKTTQIYTHLDTENLKKVYNECHPLAKRRK